MPKPATQMCSKCIGTAEPGTRFCIKHKNSDAERDRERQSKNSRHSHSGRKRWRVSRKLVLSRDPQCTHVENDKRCRNLSTDAQHVENAQTWVARGGDLYDPENLRGSVSRKHTRAGTWRVKFASDDDPSTLFLFRGPAMGYGGRIPKHEGSRGPLHRVARAREVLFIIVCPWS